MASLECYDLVFLKVRKGCEFEIMAKSKRKNKKNKSNKQPQKKKLRLLPWLGLLILPALALPFFVSGTPKIKEFGIEVLDKLPHDQNAYTQGLAYHQGYLYEGTGLYGQSSLRKVDLASGTVLKKIDLAKSMFGEGIAIVGGTIVQLTWREGKVFVYNSDTLELLREYQTDKEGWGLTYDGSQLIASDGTDKLYFHDKSDFKLLRQVLVRDNGKPVRKLNELEFIDGEIWANIWQTDRIVKIDPKTGQVTGRIDLGRLLKSGDRNGQEDVLNGIAYDPAKKRIFVTGKKYSYIYEIKIVPARS